MHYPPQRPRRPISRAWFIVVAAVSVSVVSCLGLVGLLYWSWAGQASKYDRPASPVPGSQVHAVLCRSGGVVTFVREVHELPTTLEFVTAEGERSRMELAGQSVGDLSWSPDGKLLALRRGDSGSDLWLLDADKGGLRKVTAGPQTDEDPSWSPDGSRLAFRRSDRGQGDIWAIDLSAGTEVNLTDSPEYESAPTWSPDGDTIAFIRFGELWLMDASGSNERPLPLQPGEGAADPEWSPDGAAIAFTRWYKESSSITVIHPESGDVEESTWGTRGLSPSWSPDGEAIAFVRAFPRMFEADHEIWVVDRRTGNEWPLVVQDGRYEALSDVAWGSNDQEGTG